MRVVVGVSEAKFGINASAPIHRKRAYLRNRSYRRIRLPMTRIASGAFGRVLERTMGRKKTSWVCASSQWLRECWHQHRQALLGDWRH